MYVQPTSNLWQGRIDSTNEMSKFRLHQIVQCVNISKVTTNENALSIIGFACEEGVRRNQGRLGAKEAPEAIRKNLSSIPYRCTDRILLDVGTIECEGENLEQAQKKLGDAVTLLLSKKHTPIILGGGHETLYGHYLGVRKAIGPNARLGIINIDAHFDMRDDAIPSSGTMFRQILESDNQASYLVIGIQELGNTTSLFDTAEQYNCQYILEDAIKAHDLSNVFKIIDSFSDENDYVIVTLCSDSINAAEAPGVSAPSPFGLDAKVVKQLLNYIVQKNNTLSFDISEINPRLDINEQTVKLAANLVANVIHHFNIKKGVEK